MVKETIYKAMRRGMKCLRKQQHGVISLICRFFGRVVVRDKFVDMLNGPAVEIYYRVKPIHDHHRLDDQHINRVPLPGMYLLM